MKWVEDKNGKDHWQVRESEIKKYASWPLYDLEKAIDWNKGVIKNQEFAMKKRFPDSLNYFLRGGRLYTNKKAPNGMLTMKMMKVDIKQLSKDNVAFIVESIKWLLRKKTNIWIFQRAIMIKLNGELYSQDSLSKEQLGPMTSYILEFARANNFIKGQLAPITKRIKLYKYLEDLGFTVNEHSVNTILDRKDFGKSQKRFNNS